MKSDAGALGLRNTTLHLGKRAFPTAYGPFDVHFFRDLASERMAMALVFGDLEGGAPLLARVHSSCLTSECLLGRDCDCAEQLEGAMAMIAEAGRGVVFYLMQEGRGAGLTAKARDRMMVQASENRITTFEAYAEMGLPPDLRHYDEIGPICGLLGIRGSIRLLTNNPEKAASVAKVLASEAIALAETEPIQGPTSPFNRDYLGAKFDLGHSLDRPGRVGGALPPRRVQVFEPMELAESSSLVVTASYFLPVGLASGSGGSGGSGESADSAIEIEWFRSSIVFDRESARESIVFTPVEEADGAMDVSRLSLAEPRITMSLFDRLPGSSAVGRSALVEALLELRARGRGSVVVGFDELDGVRDGHGEP